MNFLRNVDLTKFSEKGYVNSRGLPYTIDSLQVCHPSCMAFNSFSNLIQTKGVVGSKGGNLCDLIWNLIEVAPPWSKKIKTAWPLKN